ncbi:1-aminocyclopropane-1-carboxylate synthase-like protein 1 [Nephila pilipes]|uniref:1-aminocyclopropane-1-carboxylate synthase-like protein 1 n=1 Tax=Nephila pilipes TaxID=299642 RepID=A0A8X6P6V9_NEPPI|nr:1-aminocyclopropane-1-carboxylate synthase-like protein 1 [Nephila pilipes]
MNLGGDISERAQVVRNWEDFLFKYRNVCIRDEYDEKTNPDGYINLGTSVNKLSYDIILPRLTSPDVWYCDPDLLQYKESHGILKLKEALAAVMTEFFEAHEPVDPKNLFCTVGVTSCMDLLGHCLADPGGKTYTAPNQQLLTEYSKSTTTSKSSITVHTSFTKGRPKMLIQCCCSSQNYSVDYVILSPTPMYGRIFTNFMQRSQTNIWPIPVFTKDGSESSPVLTLEKVKKAYDDAIAKVSFSFFLFLTKLFNLDS